MNRIYSLAIVLLITFAANAQKEQKEPKGPTLKHYDINQESPEEVGKAVSNKLYVKYKLTDSQKEAIKSLISVKTQKIREVKAANPDIDANALFLKTKEIREQYKNDVKDILNPDQNDALDKDVVAKKLEMEQRWHNGLGRRGQGGTNNQPVSIDQAYEEYLIR